jgi:hypothetical protein
MGFSENPTACKYIYWVLYYTAIKSTKNVYKIIILILIFDLFGTIYTTLSIMNKGTKISRQCMPRPKWQNHRSQSEVTKRRKRKLKSYKGQKASKQFDER